MFVLRWLVKKNKDKKRNKKKIKVSRESTVYVCNSCYGFRCSHRFPFLPYIQIKELQLRPKNRQLQKPFMSLGVCVSVFFLKSYSEKVIIFFPPFCKIENTKYFGDGFTITCVNTYEGSIRRNKGYVHTVFRVNSAICFWTLRMYFVHSIQKSALIKFAI